MIQPRLLFVFLDGVGLGPPDAQVNPFTAAHLPVLETLLGGPFTSDLAEVTRPELVFRQLDATLGFPGLPQSATGQSSILTGRNAAQVMNGHYGPWTGPTLQRMLAEGNLFQEFLTAGLTASIANAYPPGFFKALRGRHLRLNAPAFAYRAAGGRLSDLARYAAGQAVSSDLTGEYLHSLDAAAPVLSPAGSGALLARLAGQQQFTFFDFWLSDARGHRGSFSDARTLAAQVDAFLGGVQAAAGPDLTVVITSDHGNLEDKSVRTHTRAAVPLIVTGPGAAMFRHAAGLTDLAPAIRQLFSGFLPAPDNR
jgi:hypothetical protein